MHIYFNFSLDVFLCRYNSYIGIISICPWTGCLSSCNLWILHFLIGTKCCVFVSFKFQCSSKINILVFRLKLIPSIIKFVCTGARNSWVPDEIGPTTSSDWLPWILLNTVGKIVFVFVFAGADRVRLRTLESVFVLSKFVCGDILLSAEIVVVIPINIWNGWFPFLHAWAWEINWCSRNICAMASPDFLW